MDFHMAVLNVMKGLTPTLVRQSATLVAQVKSKQRQDAQIVLQDHRP